MSSKVDSNWPPTELKRPAKSIFHRSSFARTRVSDLTSTEAPVEWTESDSQSTIDDFSSATFLSRTLAR